MFFDCLSESTLNKIYVSLKLIYGEFRYDKELIKQFLYRFCESRKIPFDHSCLRVLIKKEIIISDNSYMPISDVISGIYCSDFIGKNNSYFGDQMLKELLRKYSNKKISIIILED